jgi:hypothetical protein
VYAMKITNVMTLQAYDLHCRRSLPSKIPVLSHPDWRRRMGDCIYDYSRSTEPAIRPGVHNEGNRNTDLKGENSLHSTHFYYFGEKAVPVPPPLLALIKKSQGHKKIENAALIQQFETWIRQFRLNALLGEPQLKHAFDKPLAPHHLAACASCHQKEDIEETEEIIC